MKKTIYSVFFVLFATIVLTYLLSYSIKKNKHVNTKLQDTVIIKEKINISEPLISKFEILSNLKGEYKLNSIYGSRGLNTELEFWIEDGIWKAHTSSIVNNIEEGISQRDGNYLKLSKKEINKLNSMKITVGQDLSVSFINVNDTIFKTPFIESGMSYLITNSLDNYKIDKDILILLNKNTTNINDKLYLFAKDGLNLQELDFNKITGFYSDLVIILYDLKSQEFVMELKENNNGDNLYYSFKKH
jgi:hypothetical protein